MFFKDAFLESMLTIFGFLVKLATEGDLPIRGEVALIRFKDFFFRRAEEWILVIG